MKLINSYKVLKEYRSDPLAFIKKCFLNNGHTTHLKIFHKELIIISKPEDVLHVLKNNHAAYSKGRTTKALQQFLGKGLITSDDMVSWKKQNRLIRPIMSVKSIFELAPKILDTSLKFVPEFQTGEVNNAFTQMNRLTWRIILETLFSQESTREMDAWLEDILRLMEIVTDKTRSAIPLPFWVPTASNREMKRIIERFNNYVFKLIKDRRISDKKNDLIQLLIDAQDDATSVMTDHEIRDEVMTFLMAGHETITNTMTWLLIEIAKNRQYRSQLEQEADEFFKNRDFQALSDAVWSTAVIDETLRMWPPVWLFMRQAEKEDQIGKVWVPVGANVVLAPILSHHAPDLWVRPEQFRPERFFERKKIPQGAFYPFGLGPRACIGAFFAGLEAKIILATMVHHFEWELDTHEPQISNAGITLRPVNNIQMKFRRRKHV